MNNKGFAITSILYGLLVMFLLIVAGTLKLLYRQKVTMEELIDGTNGARENVKLILSADEDNIDITDGKVKNTELESIELNDSFFGSGDNYTTSTKGLYIYGDCKKYLDSGQTVSKSDFDSDCIK